MSQKPLYARMMLFILAALLLFTGSAFALNDVTISTPVLKPTLPATGDDSIAIPVRITSDVTLGGLTLGFTLKNPPPGVVFHSAAPGPVGSQFAFFSVKVDTVANLILIGGVAFPPYVAPVTDGLFANLYVKIPAGTPKSCVDIDSAFVPPSGKWAFAKSVGGQVFPTFTDPGGTGDVIIIGPDCAPTNAPPIAICQPITVDAGPGCTAAASINNGSSDPDAGQTITLTQTPPGPYPIGVTNVMLIVTDNGSPVMADTCFADVTVIDHTPPVITCPGNIVKGNDPGTCGVVATFAVSATDNCTGSSTIVVDHPSGSTFPVGVTPVMAIATDGAGNADTCNFTVTVNDTEAPVITCPANMVVNNDPGTCGAIVNFAGFTATDNCPGAPSIAVDPASGSTFPLGVTMVTAIATDGAGHKDTCQFTVTVNDVEAPVITCPADIVKGNDAGQCGGTATFAATATDNCPNPTLVYAPPSGSLFPVGVTQVRAIASDASGNQDTCFFNVTINDTEAPVVACPSNIVESVLAGETGKVVNFTVSITDNCPGAAVISNPASGFFFPLGVTTVTSIATGAHGLADTCSFTVEVKVGLTPDFGIAASPDTIYTTEGIPAPLDYLIDLTSIDGFAGMVHLDATGFPGSVIDSIHPADVTVPGSAHMVGNSGLTAAGVYEITITATENVKKSGPHTYKVYLDVQPCSAPGVVQLSTDGFDLEVEQGQNLADEHFFVTNAALCGILHFMASSDQSWVSAFPDTGTVEAGASPGTQRALKFSTAALLAGDYTAHVYVDPVTKQVPSTFMTINLTVTPPPTSLDSIYVENVTGFPGQQVMVPVNFKNDETLGGMSLGLHWSSADITLDSVSFVGSRVAGYANVNTIDNGARTLSLGMLRIPPNPCVPAGSGLWAGLWFSVAPGALCPEEIGIDSMFLQPGVEVVFSDCSAKVINPAFVAGSVTVECPVEACVSGTITSGGQPIAGAIVELYAGQPPVGDPIATDVSHADGTYKVCVPAQAKPATLYSVRAYAPGYYPVIVSAGVPSTDIELVLIPSGGHVTPTWEWVNLFCGGHAMLNGSSIPVGSVVEAWDPTGHLCGQWTVSDAGSFGFMPVYRDDPYTPGDDEGCDPGDEITVTVDGQAVLIIGGPLYWGENGDRYEACFEEYVPPTGKCIVLKQGWNLISWNIDTPVDDIQVLAADVMDNVDVILSFEQGALTYDPALPQFSTLLNADHLHGFWFRMKAEDTLCLNGPMVDAATAIPLEPSWNLVSYLPTDPMDVPTALAGIWDKVIVVLGYDNGGLTYDPIYPALATLHEMKSDFGYWIKTTDATTLYYTTPIFASPKADATHTSASYVQPVNLSNSWINLYGSDVKLNGQILPAGTVIEAYSSENLLIGQYTVRNAGKFGFMPVYGVENTNGDAVGKSAGSRITLKVNGEVADQQITWTENGDRIRVSEFTTAKGAGNVPASFTLNQNYPNPFNPETTIDYVVGKSGQVELAVYNVLGDRVKTLVSGYQAAGSYSVKWHGDTDKGDGAASGIYFYKLNTSDFTDVKKMTLLK